MSSILHELLAAGSESPNRIVMVPHEEWSEALTAATAPPTKKAATLLADLILGASRTQGTLEVGIQANHLKTVLELLPSSPEPRAESPEPE